MVFSLESGLLFWIIVVFYLCHFKLPEHQKHKAYEKNISTNSWKMYYFAALEAEIFYFRWIDVYVSKFSVSNCLLHILFVIQVCKNFWYSRIFGMNILTKSAQCAVILEQWEMWCVWYWYQHCMAGSFTQCLWYLIIGKNVWSKFLIQQMIFQIFAILSQSASFKRIILVRLRDKRERINHL